jgi:hypothetical protein
MKRDHHCTAVAEKKTEISAACRSGQSTHAEIVQLFIHFSSTNPNFYSIRTDAQRNTLGPVWRIRIALEKSSANC